MGDEFPGPNRRVRADRPRLTSDLTGLHGGDSSSRSTSGMPTARCSASAVHRLRACSAEPELPLAPRCPPAGPLFVTGSADESTARRLAEFADPVFGTRSSSRHREATLRTTRTGEQARRSDRDRAASWWTRARPTLRDSRVFPRREPTRSGTRSAATEGLPTFRATARATSAAAVSTARVLRLLHNRYDDVALTTVRPSPFVASRTTRSSRPSPNAPRRPSSLRRAELPEHRSRATTPPSVRFHATSAACARRHESARCALHRSSATRLRPRVLARWDGTAGCESPRSAGSALVQAMRGPTTTASSASLRDQDASVRRLRAVAEEEGGGASSAHDPPPAKGLEFRCRRADAGRDVSGREAPTNRRAADGRFGCRMVHLRARRSSRPSGGTRSGRRRARSAER